MRSTGAPSRIDQTVQPATGPADHDHIERLRWLTAGGPGPLTGTLATSLDFQSVVHELAAADNIIYGPPCSGRDYARGLEHALLRAENAAAGPPVPDPDRQVRVGPRGSPFGEKGA